MQLWKKVIIALFLGVFLGIILKDKAIYLKPLGDIFIRLIKMIIIPLVFFAILNGILSNNNIAAIGRIGIKAALVYFITTMFAVCIGILTGILLKPGEGVKLNFSAHLDHEKGGNFLKIADHLLQIIPDNIIGAMAQGTVLQVIFFALFAGITILNIDKQSAKKLSSIIHLFSTVVFKMVHYIVELAPLSACALTAWVIGTQGSDVLVNLLKLIFAAYTGFFIQFLVFAVMILAVTRLSPVNFFKKSLEYQTIAFSTSSSKAALPITIKVCRDKLGVSNFSSSFVLPLGASINMDGIAIYISICAIFIAQATGVNLTYSDYGLIIFTGTLGSIGGAGIPGGTLVMLPIVLGAVGLPLEGIALIAGIDRIIDMMRTAVSITGDAAVALCVDHSEGLHDKEKYNS